MAEPQQKPGVGRIVHYVSHGTPAREDSTQAFTPACRAADITEVDPDDPNRVGLMVKNPTGLFFRPLVDGGSAYDSGVGMDNRAGWSCDDLHHHGGTWHWPARV